jgi:hypothetical protein
MTTPTRTVMLRVQDAKSWLESLDLQGRLSFVGCILLLTTTPILTLFEKNSGLFVLAAMGLMLSVFILTIRVSLWISEGN